MNITLSFLLCDLRPFLMKSNIMLYFVISMLSFQRYLCCVTNHHQIQRPEIIIHICDHTVTLGEEFGGSLAGSLWDLSRGCCSTLTTVMCRRNWKFSSEMVSSNGWQIGSSSCLELSAPWILSFSVFFF